MTSPLAASHGAAPAAAPSTKGAAPPAVSDWAQASGRILVAGFFLASAVSNMGDTALELRPVLHADLGLMAQVVIYGLAFALLVGRNLRLVALALGLVMLGSSSAALLGGGLEQADYWQDLALVGALWLLASQAQPRQTVPQVPAAPRWTPPAPAPAPAAAPQLPRKVLRKHAPRAVGRVDLPVSFPR